jgi:hypothetical protein
MSAIPLWGEFLAARIEGKGNLREETKCLLISYNIGIIGATLYIRSQGRHTPKGEVEKNYLSPPMIDEGELEIELLPIR